MKLAADERSGWSTALVPVRCEQHFTEPPPRYTEATLVKELEEKGIGRPSTYAAIISTIVEREYVNKEQGRFIADDAGRKSERAAGEELRRYFRSGLHREDGRRAGRNRGRQAAVEASRGEFYTRFAKDLDNARDEMESYKRGIPTDEALPEVRKGASARTHQPQRLFHGLRSLSRLRLHARSFAGAPARTAGTPSRSPARNAAAT